MNIKPLPGWVLVEPLEEEDVTVGGVRLPESVKDYPMKGEIIEIGKGSFESSGVIREPIEYNLQNKIVLFKKFSGQDIKHEGKEYKLIEFKDLLAVIE